jgi:hypothetical protein
MKYWKLLPQILIRRTFLKKVLGQRGQSVVEFVLLLAAITSLSYFFIGFMNKNIGKYWEYSVNLIVNDKPGGPRKLNLP